MKSYELTGGARIGRANASYPLAKLKVPSDKLAINASIIGNFVFAPSDILSIKPYQQIPIIGKGIKINHRVSNYNHEVIFWTFNDPKSVIAEIRKTGFLDNANTTGTTTNPEILRKQQQGGFPIKKSFAIGAFVVWNALFITNFFQVYFNPDSAPIFGIAIKLAFGLLMATAILTLVSESFRQLILKEGRELEDVKSFLYLILFICFTFAISFGLIGI